MSLIMDATRAAQREKERREGVKGGGSPLLVPLKGKDRSSFNWKRMLVLAGAGGVVVVAARVGLTLTANSVPRALSTPGPIVQSIAAAPEAQPTPETKQSPPPPAAASSSAARTPPRPQTRPQARAPRVATVESRVPATTPSSGLQVLVEDPRGAEAARLLAAGVAAHRTGDLSTAREMYNSVLALNPRDASALNNLGVIHNAAREFERAESVLRRAIAVEPSNAGAWNNLGTALRGRGRSNDAVASFQQALAIDPQHTGARISLAQQYLVIGSLQQARQLLEEVMISSPSSAEASYALGQVLERQGDRAGAVRAYNNFIRVAPPALAQYVDAVRKRIDALSPAR